jgi:Spy/CpxP family protein refolding chaperone
MKKGSKGAFVALLVSGLSLVGGRSIEAQGVEGIMRARETLALTEDQISQLDAIRREVVAQRSAEQAEIAELRSQLAAGQIRQSELMAAQEDRADAAQARGEDVRARVDAVLTEEQRAQVELLRSRGQRVGARRPGFAPGGRGGVGRGGGVGPVGPRGRRGGGGFGL